MKFHIKGDIKLVNRLKHKNQDCYGLTRGHKQKFSIQIARETLHSGVLFYETLLHEMLHLFFFIVSAFTKQPLSDNRQHLIMNKFVKPILIETSNAILRERNLNTNNDKSIMRRLPVKE